MSKGYLVHKACEADKCKTAVKKLLAQTGYLEDNYRAFAKYDGCCVLVFVSEEGDVSYLSRTGEKANLSHLDPVVVSLFGDIAHLNGGVVLFGEAWWPGKDQFPEISGAFRRHSGDARLRLVLNDAVTQEEYDQGVSTRTFNERFQGLLSAFGGASTDPFLTTVGVAREYTANSYVTAKELAAFLVESGGFDGLIMRAPLAAWVQGSSGNDGAIIKVKHRVSIDVRVTGVVEGKGKQAGMAGAVQFKWHGKTCEVGTGMTDDRRLALWKSYDTVGKIIEVECLGFTPDGKPREPSFKGIRYDKLNADDE